MNIFTHEFTLKEKILILVLVIILLALGYYRFVDQPVRSGIQEAEFEYSDLDEEYNLLSAKVMQLQKMKTEMDGIDADASRMESYNASKQEMSFLNELLAGTEDYNISFSDVTREGDQIRRPIVLQYTASNYSEAKRILTKLYNCQYRCLIDDLDFSNDGEFYGLGASPVTVSLTANFYETMEGGTPDAGLPEDTSTNDLDNAEDSDEDELSY